MPQIRGQKLCSHGWNRRWVCWPNTHPPEISEISPKVPMNLLRAKITKTNPTIKTKDATWYIISHVYTHICSVFMYIWIFTCKMRYKCDWKICIHLAETNLAREITPILFHCLHPHRSWGSTRPFPLRSQPAWTASHRPHRPSLWCRTLAKKQLCPLLRCHDVWWKCKLANLEVTNHCKSIVLESGNSGLPSADIRHLFWPLKHILEGGQFHNPSSLPFSPHGSDGPGFVWSVEAVKQLESMKISDFQSHCMLKFWWPYHIFKRDANTYIYITSVRFMHVYRSPRKE